MSFISFALLYFDSEKIDFPISLYGRLYKKFSSLHPSNEMAIQIHVERECLLTFYTTNALPAKEAWSKMRIKKINGRGMSVLRKL